MDKYQIPFIPEADINYFYLFDLMEQATYTQSTKAYDTINYKSISKLAEQVSFSKSVLDKIIDSNHQQGKKYIKFFTVDKKQKEIKLHNCFMAGSEKRPFVVLTAQEIAFLRKHREVERSNLLCRYLIYIKYYCGKSKTKTTDFTMKQFLTATNYSTNSHSQENLLTLFNTLIKDAGLATITPFCGDGGENRNCYFYHTLSNV